MHTLTQDNKHDGMEGWDGWAYVALMKDHVSVMLMLKKCPELLNQLQASRDDIYSTGAKRAVLPINSKLTCWEREVVGEW